VLALLQAWPTAAALAAADPADVARLVAAASQGQIGPARVDALLAAARRSVAARAVEPALTAKVRVLAQRVATLDREVAELEQAIAAEFAALGYRAQDFPVGGPVSLATILSEAGDVGRYPSAKRFLSHFGWCPVDTQSGQYRDAHPRLSRAGNRFVRRVVWMLAVGAVRHPGAYRDYFLGRTAAGKNKMDSLVAVGRKILATIYAILKTGRAYDPAYAADRAAPRGAVTWPRLVAASASVATASRQRRCCPPDAGQLPSARPSWGKEKERLCPCCAPAGTSQGERRWAGGRSVRRLQHDGDTAGGEVPLGGDVAVLVGVVLHRPRLSRAEAVLDLRLPEGEALGWGDPAELEADVGDDEPNRPRTEEATDVLWFQPPPAACADRPAVVPQLDQRRTDDDALGRVHRGSQVSSIRRRRDARATTMRRP
jgi:hypothetical protein